MDPALQDRRIQTVCLLVITSIAVGAALHWLQPVMIPFTLAVFFVLALNPAVELQMRVLRMPRAAAVAGTLLLSVLLFTLVAALVSASVRELANNAAGYQAKLEQLATAAAEALPLERLGVPARVVEEPLSELPVSAVGTLLRDTTNAILEILSSSVLVLLFVLFLLVEGGSGAEPRREGTWAEVRRRVERYIVTKALVSAATGMLVWLTLALLGIDLALVFGLFAFLLNFVPSIGSIISTLLPLPVVIASPGISLPVAVAAIGIPAAIQFTIGNVIEPKVMGGSLDLHPVVILLALIFWGMLWGVVGMLLATPITAVMKILFEKMDYTRPVAAVLAGRLDRLGAAPRRA